MKSTTRFIDVMQAAERIGVTTVRVRQMQLAGELPSADVRARRNMIVWRAETIEPWLALYDERRAWEERRGAMLAELAAGALGIRTA